MGNIADKKLAKKMKMLDAAYELFLEKDVNLTAIDDIVKRAGVAKGTFYLYFRDKYDILDQIVIHKGLDLFSNAITEMKNANSSGILPFKEQLWILTDYMMDYLTAHKELVALIKKNLSSCVEFLFSETAENPARGDIESKKQRSLDFIYEEAASKGINKESAQKTIYILTNMISSVCCDAILYNKPYTIEEMRPQIHYVIEKIVE